MSRASLSNVLRSPGRAGVCLCFVIAALGLAPPSAEADCRPDDADELFPPADRDDWLPFSGGTVNCIGIDDNGFERNGADFTGGRNNLTINVAEGAFVGGTFVEGGIRLFNSVGSTVNNSGTVEVEISISGDQPTITNNETGVADSAFARGAGAKLTNFGTILISGIAEGNGAVVLNEGTVQGDLGVAGEGGRLTNTADGTAGFVLADGDGSVVTNNNTITLGMEVRGSNVTVRNNAGILGSSVNANAMTVLGSGTIENHGSIMAMAFAEQIGIAGLFDGAMSVTSTGTIEASGIGIGLAADATAPAGAEGTIVNSGAVTTNGAGSPGLGLRGGGRITNTATGTVMTRGRDSEGIGSEGFGVVIVNDNSIHTLGINSAGIDKAGDFGTVTNNGTIQTAFGNSPGILVVGDGLFATPTIIHSGTITTDAFVSPGIAVNGDGQYVQTAEGSIITTTGSDADGIWTSGVRVVENGGAITTSDIFSDGIESAGMTVYVDNLDSGSINVSGAAATGITVNGALATVNNAGSVRTSGDAIWGVYVNGDNATVRNDGGSIITVATGIYVTGNEAQVENLPSTAGGFIQTTGSASHGIEVEGNGAQIDNSRDIDTDGGDAIGVMVTGDSATVRNLAGGNITSGGAGIHIAGEQATAVNEASIDSGLGAGAANADGIRVAASGVTAPTVTNSGFIDTFAPESDGIEVSADFGVARVTNNGRLTTNANNSAGIRLTGKAEFRVDSSGDIFTFGTSSHGIAVDRTALAAGTSITVEGEVDASGAGSRAIRLASAAGAVSTVTNAATGFLKGDGEAILGGPGNETVRNSGTISGDVSLEGGDDTFFNAADSTVTGTVAGGDGTMDELIVGLGDGQVLDGEQFVEFEVLSVTGQGEVTIENTLSIGASEFGAGTVILAGGAVLGGDAVVNGGTLKGDGSVAGSLETTTGGTTGPGTSTGTLSVGQNFLLDGGRLAFEANSLFDFDVLDVAGDAVLADGVVEVVLAFTPGAQDVLELLRVGGTLDVLAGFDGIDGAAAAGSGVALGTLFTVSLGGQQFQGTVTSVVPVPPAFWLFGTALLALARGARSRQRGGHNT